MTTAQLATADATSFHAARVSGRGGNMLGQRLVAAIPPLLLACTGLIVWLLAARLLDNSVVPTPLEAMASLQADFGSERFRASVLDTVRVLAAAFAVAALAGTVLGVAVGLSAFWSRAILPLSYAFNSVPKVTLFPIFLLFLGLGDGSRGAFAVYCGILPMFLVAAEATRGVPRLYLKLSASLRLGRMSLLRRIVIPAVLPSLASGLTLTFGLTFVGLILAEMFAGSSGIGQEMLRNVALVRMGNIVGEVILVAIIALVPTLLLRWAERKVTARFGGLS